MTEKVIIATMISMGILEITIYQYLKMRKRNRQQISDFTEQNSLYPEMNRYVEEIDALVMQTRDQIAGILELQGNNEEAGNQYRVNEKKLTGQERRLLARYDEFLGTSEAGNQVINVMLFGKRQRCRELGIQFADNMQIPEEWCMDAMELVSLCGNVLDNAIEACEKVEMSRRYISIKARERANIWTLKIENSKNPKETPKEKEFMTTKQDAQNHGLGMRIIDKIVKKYDGIFEFRDLGDSVVIVISILCRENKGINTGVGPGEIDVPQDNSYLHYK